MYADETDDTFLVGVSALAQNFLNQAAVQTNRIVIK